jgi:site-specific DNA-methyltransferase (adenine-specific)
MTPYYEDDAVTIYHGDCREILPALDGVDLVLTDPPYNEVNRHSAGLRTLDRGGADSLPVDVDWLARTLPTVATGSIYVWCGMEQVSVLRAGLVAQGMSTRTCVWHKSNPSPMNGQLMWLSAIELCVFARHKKATFTRHCEAPVWFGPTEPRDDHPTAKPEWLFKRLIVASSLPGDVVLDPFMGSGTTLRAAKDLGRHAVGIEISERYCETAVNRLAQEVLPL